jgi:mRNA interferase RelE/StbE
VASYSVVLRNSAARELKALQKDELHSVVTRIGALAEEPLPSDSEQLSTRARYRIRVGAVRIVYEVEIRAELVIITRIVAHPRARIR